MYKDTDSHAETHITNVPCGRKVHGHDEYNKSGSGASVPKGKFDKAKSADRCLWMQTEGNNMA